MNVQTPYVEKLKKRRDINGNPCYIAKLRTPEGKQKRFPLPPVKSEEEAKRKALELQYKLNDKRYYQEYFILFDSPTKIPTEKAFQIAADHLLKEGGITDSEFKRTLRPMFKHLVKKFILKKYRYLGDLVKDNQFRSHAIEWLSDNYRNTRENKTAVSKSNSISQLISDFPMKFKYYKQSKSLVYLGVMSKKERESYLQRKLNQKEKESITDLYRASQNPKEIKPQTINNQFKILNKILNKCVELRFIPTYKKLVLMKIKETNQRGTVEPEQFQKLLDACNWYMKGILLLYWVSGCRRSEPFSLNLSDISLEKMTIRIRPENHKNGSERIVLIPDNLGYLHSFLSKLMSHHYDPQTRKLYYRGEIVDKTNEPLFKNRFGRRIQSCSKAFDTIRKKTEGCGHISFHWFRHTITTELHRLMPLKDVQKFIGHKSIKSTLRYIHPSQLEKLRKAFNTRDINFEL